MKAETPVHNVELAERLQFARRFIDEQYKTSLNLGDISSQAGLSRYHFLRLFRAAFQITPHQYLIHRRISQAKELLRAPNGPSVTDVCFEVGFQSLGSFSSLFHRIVGETPIAYRRRQFESLKKVHGCFVIMFGLHPPSPKSF